jgi:CBS domain-containing protein
MARNSIPDRIAHALRQFPPFSMFGEEAVGVLAREAEVQVLVAGDFVWRQGDPPGTLLRFLARGRVEYFFHDAAERERVDVRDVGDLLGLTALMEGAPFRVSAEVVEDSLLYCFPWDRIKGLLDAHDAARNYARRHLFWATRVGRSTPRADAASSGAVSLLQAQVEGARVIEVRPLERLLTCLPDSPISEAANLIVSKRVPSVLVVDEARRPVGMVTSTNLVKQVIVGGRDPAEPVASVMASPVVTVAPQSSATAAILLMLRERIGQVCVTEDGTPHSPALDVRTQKDLLAQSGHHPAGLIREIRLARSPARFRELCDDVEEIARGYLDGGISGVLLGQVCAELYDELLLRLIEEAKAGLQTEGWRMPKVPWAWMAVGSDGRREQVLRTDMDNALIFADQGSAEANEAARAAFLRLAERVIGLLVECGFSRCQGGVMASNPRWCRSDLEWGSELAAVPERQEGEAHLRAMVLYDLRHVAGDRALCDALRRTLFASARENRGWMHRLAEYCVETPPPLNFWGKFVVEKKGEHTGEFDLKARGLSPLRDAARLFALRHRLMRHYSTGGRWLELSEVAPAMAEVATLANESYDLLLRLRIATGLRRGDSGRYVQTGDLSKLQRSQLTNVFDVLRMVQDAVRREFNLEVRTR